MAQTEYKDRSGKPIYTGDIVQYKLSSPSKCIIVKSKRGIFLCFIRAAEQYSLKDSLPMRSNLEQHISIIDTRNREE